MISHRAAALLLCATLSSGCEEAQPPSNDSAPVSAERLAPVSGLEYQSEDTVQLQTDDFANPGMLAVDEGARLWASAPQEDASACADCHSHEVGNPHPMQGVALRYPRYHADAGRLENLEQRINRCRTQQQHLPALPYESAPLLALSAFVANQSRGLVISDSVETQALPFLESGRRYYYERRGQMNLACHHCHERNAGMRLRGDLLSQGHGNGYPAYRLEWQRIGSLQRRLRFCNVGVRAEPHPYGAEEYVNLELFLRWRAAGLTMETPAVRR